MHLIDIWFYGVQYYGSHTDCVMMARGCCGMADSLVFLLAC